MLWPATRSENIIPLEVQGMNCGGGEMPEALPGASDQFDELDTFCVMMLVTDSEPEESNQ
jgi:Mg-chelatase subunit ChlD